MRIISIAVAAGVAALAATGPRVTSSPIALLAAASARTGVIESRLGGFPYASRGAEHNLRLRADVNAAAAKATGDRRATAIALLLVGKRAAAVATLESQAAREPLDPTCWSDLAAARYENAVATGDMRMCIAAIAAADRALDLDPRHAEATFNRAVALAHAGFRRDAAAAFRAYLAIDGSSPWADDARQRLRRCLGPTIDMQWRSSVAVLETAVGRGDTGEVDRIVGRFPEEARRWAEGEFLAHWGEALLAGDTDRAAHWLAVTRSIATSLRSLSGESLLHDVVTQIGSSDLQRVRRIAAAHVAYRDARRVFSSREVSTAIQGLRDAETQFASVDSPMRSVAAYFRANAAHDAHDMAEAAQIYEALAPTVPPQYVALRAQLDWLRAMVYGWTDRPLEAIHACRSAVSAFERLRERDSATRTRAILASMLALFGDDAEAWRVRAPTFRQAVEVGKPTTIEMTINHAARDEAADRQWDTARALLRVQLAQPSINARLRSDVLLRLALVEAQIHGTRPDFRKATEATAKVQDDHLREDAQDELNFARGAFGRLDLKTAVELLSSVIEYRTRRRRDALLPDAYMERARAFREMRREDAAEADLRNALRVTESLGKHMKIVRLRDSYFGAASDVSEELVDLLSAQSRHDETFEVADRGRTRVIAERARHLGPSDFAVEAVQRRLPSGTSLVHLTALPDRTIVTIVRRDGSSTRTVPLARAELTSRIDQLRDAILRDDLPQASATGADLFTQLFHSGTGLEPVVVIVPDETTSAIPFAALRTPAGKWLVQEREVVLAPSAAAYRPDLRPPPSSKTRFALVLDPQIDRSLFPNLDQLGRVDLALLQRLRSVADVLWISGLDATRERIIELLQASDIAQISAHAFADADDASRSLFAVAPARNSPGVLYAREIEELQLDNRLVILAGCSTGTIGGGSGSVRSLALSFLAAGSRSVAATLWDVENVASSKLTSAMYESLQSGVDPSSSLRKAQLHAIQLPNSNIRTWAAFQLWVTQ